MEAYISKFVTVYTNLELDNTCVGNGIGVWSVTLWIKKLTKLAWCTETPVFEFTAHIYIPELVRKVKCTDILVDRPTQYRCREISASAAPSGGIGIKVLDRKSD